MPRLLDLERNVRIQTDAGETEGAVTHSLNLAPSKPSTMKAHTNLTFLFINYQSNV